MNYDKIGKFIQELRKEKKLTQKDLAHKLNITDKAVSKWERGKGCPDVSILENLSIILDISILELLKGRKIEKEELNDDNVNDLILDTINYSKEQIIQKYKKFILNILTVIIIIIVSFLTILNIYHISYLNKKYQYDFDTDQIKNININLNKIKENINKFKNSELKYTEQENGQLLDIIEGQYNLLRNHPLLKYQGKLNLTINDLYIIDNYYYNETEIYFGYKILGNYESRFLDYTKHYVTILMVKGYNGISLYQEAPNSYKYNITNNNFIDNYKVSARVYNLLYITEELLILSENAIEVGENYE